jgi:hypothetical protein
MGLPVYAVGNTTGTGFIKYLAPITLGFHRELDTSAGNFSPRTCGSQTELLKSTSSFKVLFLMASIKKLPLDGDT